MKRQPSPKLPTLALMLVGVILSSMANAAFDEYTVIANSKELDWWPTYFLVGEILPGDYEKFKNIISERGEFPSTLTVLHSPGGDLVEAMKIGRLLRQSLTTVQIFDSYTCLSACFFILVGSPDRDIRGGTIGLHRPYYDTAYFGGLNLEEAERQYAELDTLAREYLIEMNVPNHIIEQMFAIPSGEMERPSNRDVQRYIDGRTPAYGEWLAAKCGKSTRTERRRIKVSERDRERYSCETREIEAQRKVVYRKLISWW